MKYTSIIAAIVVVGLIYSSYYFYSENNSLNDNLHQLNSTFDNYKKTHVELKASYQNLQEESDIYEKEIEENLELLSQLGAEKDALNQSYEQLSESFDELIDMNSNTEGYVRVTLYNVSFEYPEDLLVTVDSLYPGSQIASSGIFIATSASFDQVVSLSWENVDSEPNLTLVFDDTFGSFGNVVTMNQSSVHNYLDQELLFVSFDVSHPDSSNNFYLVSNWYDEVTQYHFVLIIQSYRNDVIDQFESFVSSYRSIDS